MLQLFWLLYTLMARIIFALFASLSKTALGPTELFHRRDEKHGGF
jgi:hypothetical protein